MKQPNGDSQHQNTTYPHLTPLLPPHLLSKFQTLPPTAHTTTLQQLDAAVQQRQNEVQQYVSVKQQQIKVEQKKINQYEKYLSLLHLSPSDLQHQSPSKHYSTDNLTHQVYDATDALASITQMLCSASSATGHLLPTIIQLRQAVYESDLEYQQLQYDIQKLRQQNSKVEQQLQHVQDVHEQTLADHTNKQAELQHARSAVIPTMRLKSIEYDTDLKQLKQQIVDSGFDDRYTHESIVQRHDEVGQLGSLVDSLRQRLRAYSDLPADMQLAELKLAESQYRLKQLDDKLTALIDKQMAGG